MVNICNRSETDKCRMTITTFVCMGVAMVGLVIWLSVLHRKHSELEDSHEVLKDTEKKNHDTHVQQLSKHAVKMDAQSESLAALDQKHTETKAAVDQNTGAVAAHVNRLGSLESMAQQVTDAINTRGDQNPFDDIKQDKAHSNLVHSLRLANDQHRHFHEGLQKLMPMASGLGGMSKLQAADNQSPAIHTYACFDANGVMKTGSGDEVIRLVTEMHKNTEETPLQYMHPTNIGAKTAGTVNSGRSVIVTTTGASADGVTHLFRNSPDPAEYTYLEGDGADVYGGGMYNNGYVVMVNDIMRDVDKNVRTAAAYLKGKVKQIDVSAHDHEGKWYISGQNNKVYTHFVGNTINGSSSTGATWTPMTTADKTMVDEIKKKLPSGDHNTILSNSDMVFKSKAEAEAAAQRIGEWVDTTVQTLHSHLQKRGMHASSSSSRIQLLPCPTMPSAPLRSLHATTAAIIPGDVANATNTNLSHVFVDHASLVPGIVATPTSPQTPPPPPTPLKISTVLANTLSSDTFGIYTIQSDGTLIFKPGATTDSHKVPFKVTVRDNVVFRCVHAPNTSTTTTYTMKFQTQHSTDCEIEVRKPGSDLSTILRDGGNIYTITAAGGKMESQHMTLKFDVNPGDVDNKGEFYMVIIFSSPCVLLGFEIKPE